MCSYCVDRALRRAEDPPHHRLERFERHRLERRLERGAVVPLAAERRLLEARVAAELLAQVPVEADVVEEVVALEDAVLLDHPEVLSETNDESWMFFPSHVASTSKVSPQPSPANGYAVRFSAARGFNFMMR